MENQVYMICNICKQKVRARKGDSYNGSFPVDHQNPETKDRCHGFYVGGHLVKED